MSHYKASMLNAIVLISLGLWGYFGSNSPSISALIPVIIGFLLLLLNPWVKKEHKIGAHIAVILTGLVLIGLIKPLLGALDRADNYAIFRVLTMQLSTLLAITYFIRSFKEARRNKA